MWFVFRVQYKKEGQTVKSVYDYAEYSEALQRYHATLASDIGNDELSFNLCMILDYKGNTVEKYFYEHKVEE